MNKLKHILESDRKTIALLALLIFLPVFFHGWRPGIPYVKGGDEPHYMTMLHSLVNDGDFDLKNNYLETMKGSHGDIGRKYRGGIVDPHIVFSVDGHYISWWNVYDENLSAWKRDEQGNVHPAIKPGAEPKALEAPWLPGHPIGIALILMPFLFLLRDTPFIEPAAIMFSSLAVILAAWFFRRIIGRFYQDAFTANLLTVLVFLGTPVWPYGRMFFNESFILFFVMGAMFFALKKDSGLWAGVFLGLGSWMKPVIVVLAVPLFLFWLIKRKLLNTALLALSLSAFVATSMLVNFKIYGILSHHTKFVIGNPPLGALAFLFQWNHGLLMFSPIVLFAILFWKKFFKRFKVESLVLLGGFSLYYLLMASWWCWWCGWCFGPRLIIPIIPLLMPPLGLALQDYPDWRPWKKNVFRMLVVLSLAFNALGALDGYWDSHPLTLLMGKLG